MIRSGTCAWADHQHFYPRSLRPSERLRYYARRFSVVEVDCTYYGLPRPAVVSAWSEAVADDFIFHVKAFRDMTLHDRSEPNLAQKERHFAALDELLQPLRNRRVMGAVLFQYPPWFYKKSSHMAYVAACREYFQTDLVAIEFRNRTWWHGKERDDTLQFLTALQAVHVVSDEPQVGDGCVPLVSEVTDSRLAIVRFHGRNAATWATPGLSSSAERFNYLYSREELNELVPMVRSMAARVAETHLLMNNNFGDYAVRNAAEWQEILDLPRDASLFVRDTTVQPGWFDE